MENVEIILISIAKHSELHPDHGIYCACMDRFIQHIRRLTTSADPKVQQRIDYVLRTVVNGR